MKDAERLLELALAKGALRYGDFMLSSGQKTGYYFDGRLLTLDPEGAYLVGEIFLDILIPGGVEYVGGPTLAADPMVTAVAVSSHLRGRPMPAFIVRKEVKGHGTERLIEGPLTNGARVGIVDDVCTTGASLFHAIDAAEQMGCNVVKVVTIVDRRQGGSDELRRRGYDFTCLAETNSEGKLALASSVGH